MSDVFHLATPEQWATAQTTGIIAPPSLELEGFVHCSTEEQLAGTIDRHFTGVDALALLRLDLTALGDDLRWDEVRPGQVYPHVYRAIRVDEVLDVRPWTRDPA
ncbi:MAG: DUF952 domain-containing protein [Actinomycetota bacterium]|nr:DUF952 domain-containing protein [Actinomycetota bacterium]